MTMANSVGGNAGLIEIMQLMAQINQNQRNGLMQKAREIAEKGENATQEDMQRLQVAADTFKNMSSGTQSVFDVVRTAQAKAADSVRV